MATGKIIASQEVLHNLIEHCYDQFKSYEKPEESEEASQFHFIGWFLKHIYKEVGEGHPFSTLVIQADNS